MTRIIAERVNDGAAPGDVVGGRALSARSQWDGAI